MFRKKLLILLSFLCLNMIVVLTACTGGSNEDEKTPEPTEDPRIFRDELPRVEPREDQHITFKTIDDGFDVFAPLAGHWGYRYGPSILFYPDGTMDAWFATPGTSGEWDWFTYKHSDDRGATWSNEIVVLQPTPDSMDHYSVCDPGLIYFDGWYYLGYTSTIVSTNGGINNNIFVSRSKNPDGPFEKWNGSGWGGDPAPIIYFDEADSAWGAGEISFVELDGTLYCYYTWRCPDGDFTKVSIADSTSENWPETLEYKGIAYKYGPGQDSCDVFYVEDIGKFIALSTIHRFTTDSGIAIMESNDGINFTHIDTIRTGISKFCHNMGVSKRPNGHVQVKDDLIIGYAYSDGGQENWGKWATRFQKIKLEVYDGEAKQTDRDGKNVLRGDYFWEELPKEELWPIAIGTLPQKIEVHLKDGTYKVPAKWYDTYLRSHDIKDGDKVKFTDYDKEIVDFDGLTMTMKKVGKTNVTMHYEGRQITFKVYVRPDDFQIGMENPEIVSFTPVEEHITVYKKDYGVRHKKQIRGFVVFEDETWGEAYNDSTKAHPDYPPKVPREKYEMKFEVADTSVITVNNRGIITAKNVGTTTVKVTITGGHSFTVTVTVEEELP